MAEMMGSRTGAGAMQANGKEAQQPLQQVSQIGFPQGLKYVKHIKSSVNNHIFMRSLVLMSIYT